MDPYGLFNLSTSAREISQFANALTDWKETPEGHVFKADLPGLKKEEVKVEVKKGRILQISGERKEEQEEKNDKWHQIERSSGKFRRRFPLPENAKVEEVKTSMENGVLTVTLPKVEEKKRKVKEKERKGPRLERCGARRVRRQLEAPKKVPVVWKEAEPAGRGKLLRRFRATSLAKD